MIQKHFSAISHGCDDSFASSAKSPRRVVSAAIISLSVALSGVFLAMSQVAFAGSITYPNPATGSFPGNTVIYGPDLGPADHGVTESSMTDAVPLYGMPTVTGDSMSFTPSGFGSFSQNGGLDITDGQLVFKVLAKPGQAINNITFSEAGAVSLLGLGGAGTLASDSLAVHITILEVNGVGINAIHLGPSDFAPQPTFIPKGSFNLATDGQLNLAPWKGNLSVTFLPFLLSNGFKNTDKVTKISVDLDNQLMTISQANPNTIALIDKKTFFTVTTNTPEPASCVLALIGFVGAAFFARRRSV